MKDDTFGWNRRFFVGGAAVATIASFYLAAVARGALEACSYEVEAGLPSELQSLIRIGNSYLNEHTQNGELETLDEALFDETETRSVNIVFAVQRRLLAIDRQVRDEFARYETVICDGWVLAKSEARLCAILAARARRL
jgi:hypothetical protein